MMIRRCNYPEVWKVSLRGIIYSEVTNRLILIWLCRVSQRLTPKPHLGRMSSSESKQQIALTRKDLFGHLTEINAKKKELSRVEAAKAISIIKTDSSVFQRAAFVAFHNPLTALFLVLLLPLITGAAGAISLGIDVFWDQFGKALGAQIIKPKLKMRYPWKRGSPWAERRARRWI